MTSPASWLNEARRRHDVALRLFNAGDYPEAVGRALYAMYSAARALLNTVPVQTHSHGGVTSMLNEHFVRTGHVDAHHLAAYSRVLHRRIRLDYYADPVSPADARMFVQAAREFISETERILS